MCLAIPMQIIQLDGDTARCRAAGVERDVSLFLLQDDAPVIGDFVLVHVGYAIQKVAAPLAQEAWALHAQMQGGVPGDA